ncbi:hypothetical protein DRJ17_00340 [Candidatus Woesearchaeota archaeon]|nr:MAG: hypothetical protein DRJ17_00340 [Candidatus Woesearchaeota archaeon]
MAETKEETIQLKNELNQIREELDEHLIGINENTTEIETQYEYLSEIDAKIEKLSEKIDDIYLFLGVNKEHYELKRELTLREKEIFKILYQEEVENVDFRFIARTLILPVSLVKRSIDNMIAKGVPINKKFLKSGVYLSLDRYFKRLQAKFNLVGIENSPKKIIQLSLFDYR